MDRHRDREGPDLDPCADRERTCIENDDAAPRLALGPLERHPDPSSHGIERHDGGPVAMRLRRVERIALVERVPDGN